MSAKTLICTFLTQRGVRDRVGKEETGCSTKKLDVCFFETPALKRPDQVNFLLRQIKQFLVILKFFPDTADKNTAVIMKNTIYRRYLQYIA